MINPEKVLNRLKLTVSLSPEDEGKALILCSEAASQLEPRLRSPLYGDDPRVIAAAAALAQSFGTVSAGENISSFKAGDVSVTMEKGTHIDSEKAVNDALAAAAPCLSDDGFMFREV